MPEVLVRELIESLRAPLHLEVCAGRDGGERPIRAARIQKPGLALAGYSAFIHPDRVQVLGQTEISYLAQLDPVARERAATTLTSLTLACVLVTKGLPPPSELIHACDRTRTPLLRTPVVSSEAIDRVITYLAEMLMPRTSIHGVLIDVGGVGVLVTGASGIGKSECALELVRRGHRLVADDVVEIRRRGNDLVGQASALIRGLLEIRGLGILDVADLYGVTATRDHKRIELHVELEDWRRERVYDRTGLDERRHDILGVKLRSLLMPVRSGRDVASLVEVASRNFLLNLRGHNAAQVLKGRIDAEMAGSSAPRERVEEMLPPDDDPTEIGEAPSLHRAAHLSAVLDHLEDEVE